MIANPTLRGHLETYGPVEGLGRELHRTKNCLKAIYDFTSMGGVQGTLELLDDWGARATLPAKARVTKVWVEGISGLTSSGASIYFTAVTLGDLYASAASDIGTGDIKDGNPTGAAGTIIKVGATQAIVKATIDVADITGGRVLVYIEYVLGE